MSANDWRLALEVVNVREGGVTWLIQFVWLSRGRRERSSCVTSEQLLHAGPGISSPDDAGGASEEAGQAIQSVRLLLPSMLYELRVISRP